MSETPGGFYVANVDRSEPGRTTYHVVADVRGGKLPVGSVVIHAGGARTHLAPSREVMRSLVAANQIDAAVDHYRDWAASHEQEAGR